MPGIGHFPVSENHSHCQEYLLPALRALERARRSSEGMQRETVWRPCCVPYAP
jgi:hypothetical protein